VYHAELFKVLQCGKQLNCEPTDKTVVKALIVVHLYELIQVDAVQVKHETKVISPHEVIY
jgi:hypothetical protein